MLLPEVFCSKIFYQNALTTGTPPLTPLEKFMMFSQTR